MTRLFFDDSVLTVLIEEEPSLLAVGSDQRSIRWSLESADEVLPLTPRRFPKSVYEQGAEPDARFSLANERTFLAWIRTALALIAAGVALEAFALPIEPTFRLTAAIVLIGLGVLAPMQAWLGWMSTERALRLEKPLPAPHLAGPIGIGVVATGLLLVVGLLLP